MDRYQVAAIALALALACLIFSYAYRVADMGDEVDARLDALAVAEVASVPEWPRYARFERRDYDHERGPVPAPAPRYATIYDEICARLGVTPC